MENELVLVVANWAKLVKQLDKFAYLPKCGSPVTDFRNRNRSKRKATKRAVAIDSRDNWLLKAEICTLHCNLANGVRRL